MSLDFEIRSRPKRLSCATLPSLPSTGNLACLRYWVSIVQDRYQQEICHALRYWVAKTATNRKFVMPCSIGLPRLLPTGNFACLLYWVAKTANNRNFDVPAVLGCHKTPTNRKLLACLRYWVSTKLLPTGIFLACLR